MNAIPERLRERAIRVMQELHTCLAPAHQECDSAEAAIAQALHEIAQAARIEGERAGAERMREAAAVSALNACLMPPDGGSPSVWERELCAAAADRIRALPAPAVHE